MAAAAGPEDHWLAPVPKAAAAAWDVPPWLALVAMPSAHAAADHPGLVAMPPADAAAAMPAAAAAANLVPRYPRFPTALVAMPSAHAAADHPGLVAMPPADAAAAMPAAAAAANLVPRYPRFPTKLMPAAENQGFVTVMLQRWHKPTSHQRQRASRNRAIAAAALTV